MKLVVTRLGGPGRVAEPWPFCAQTKKTAAPGALGAAAKCSIAFHRTQRQCHQHTRWKIYRWIYAALSSAILVVRWLYPMKPAWRTTR